MTSLVVTLISRILKTVELSGVRASRDSCFQEKP